MLLNVNLMLTLLWITKGCVHDRYDCTSVFHIFLHVFHVGASEVEKTLLKALFSNYTLKVRPAISPEQRVVVRVGMILSSFVGLVRLRTPNNA